MRLKRGNKAFVWCLPGQRRWWELGIQETIFKTGEIRQRIKLLFMRGCMMIRGFTKTGSKMQLLLQFSLPDRWQIFMKRKETAKYPQRSLLKDSMKNQLYETQKFEAPRLNLLAKLEKWQTLLKVSLPLICFSNDSQMILTKLFQNTLQIHHSSDLNRCLS